MAINCKMCGTSNDDNIQFCGACGSPLKGDPGQVRQEAPKAKGLPAKTMMFGVSPVAAKPAQPAPAAAKQAPMAAVTPAATPAAQQKKALENQRTVMGFPAVVVAPPASQPAADTPSPGCRSLSKRRGSSWRISASSWGVCVRQYSVSP